MSAALAVAGVVLFSYAWTAHSGYYGEFGLAPEDVGLGYGTVITQAGTAMVFLAAGTVALVAPIAMAQWWRAHRLVAASAALAAFAVVAVLPWLVGIGAQILLLIWIWLLLLIAGGLVLMARPTLLGGLALAGAALLIAAGFVVAHATGAATARAVILDGRQALVASRQLPGLSPAQVSFVSWDATSVAVAVTAGAPPVRDGDDDTGLRDGFYLLGASDGDFVLWDACLEQVVLLPSSSTRLTYGARAAERRRAEGGFGGGGTEGCLFTSI